MQGSNVLKRNGGTFVTKTAFDFEYYFGVLFWLAGVSESGYFPVFHVSVYNLRVVGQCLERHFLVKKNKVWLFRYF